MTNSLQDQLLKAGLVNKSQLSKANKAKRKKTKQRGAKSQPGDEQTILAQQTRQQKIARDRDLNQEIVKKQQRKAATAEIQQLLDTHAVKDPGDVVFNFQHKRRVKQVSVSEDTHTKLVAGQLAIVRFSGRYWLIPPAVLQKVRERDGELFSFRASSEASNAADDEYADYEVPDDLMW